ncbi:hypothetical protein HHL22_22170 [Hymenobacter sp. RP-2-7]|uniref:Uncharacterized protein n=1 Tax=Hymenobacter polaris TaxID=2682546 RepID=A0A7Y0AIC3_9BACT|nr:hypothetical protein [Hymenobacter polaris]NML67916.1 hypothetical protein [Hymenobacter polaris]
MKYRPRQPETRLCAHCHTPYSSAHKRRLYCGNSCANLASYARRPRSKAPQATPTLGAVPETPTPSVNLAASWQNVAMLTGSHLAAKLVGVLGERLLGLFTPPPAAQPLETLDPAHWLPAALLSAPAPRLELEMPWWDQPQVFLQLTYFGHTLYYQPRHRCLLWRVGPGQVLLLFSPEQLAAVAELTPGDYVPTPLAEPEAHLASQLVGELPVSPAVIEPRGADRSASPLPAWAADCAPLAAPAYAPLQAADYA